MSERKIVSVSLPRAGHHMVMRVLEGYFQERFHYCEFYTIRECCKTIPCARHHGESAIFVQKTHDFDSETPILVDQPYLVQVRHIVTHILSSFDLWVHYVGKAEGDTGQLFLTFAMYGLRYYKSFFERWIFNPALRKAKLVVYERVVSRPLDEIAGIVEFITDDGALDWQRLRVATAQEQISPKPDIRQRRYYDPAILRFVENEAARELEYLGLPKMF